MKRARGARSNSSRSRQRRRNNKATGHSAEQRAYGQKMPILSLYKIYNIFELFLLHTQSHSHCQFLLQFHVHSSIPPLLQSLATSAGGGARARLTCKLASKTSNVAGNWVTSGSIRPNGPTNSLSRRATTREREREME